MDPKKTDPPHGAPGEGARAGRVRPPTEEEIRDRGSVLLPNAVLALDEKVPITNPIERRVADLVDGFRPVARIRQKSGLGALMLQRTLSSLQRGGAISLVGIVEEVAESDAAPSGLLADVPPAGAPEAEHTMPRSSAERIPEHILKEIEGMIADVEREKGAPPHPDDLFADDPGGSASGFDDEKTTETKLPDDDPI